MPPIYGPGHHPETNETTTRPEQTATGKASDTWFAQCDPGDPDSGTQIDAEWLNFIIANMRNAIRGMGVAENETDDDMLLKAIQAAVFSHGFLDAPFFPEVLTADGKMNVTNQGGGTIEVASGQRWLHRMFNAFDTDDIALVDRQFVTAASKTYHLRWDYNKSGGPGFELQDLADVSYNASASAEDDDKFDTTYDDMLVARIVTDASNVPTITTLINKHDLKATSERYVDLLTDSHDNQARGQDTFTLEWSRAPIAHASWTYISNTGQNPTGFDVNYPDVDNRIIIDARTRYGVDLDYWWDYAEEYRMRVSMFA